MPLINEKRRITDDLGREFEYPFPPQRVVSLCPSITETLLALGAPVVGRTRYCIHPADQVKGIPDVGGTKKLRFEDIDALKPDLIIAEKEENTREDVARLEKHYPVYVCDVVDIDSALKMIGALGRLCGADQQATAMESEISLKFKQIEKSGQPLRVAYLIWRKPWMAVGNNTYIDNVLSRCGLTNVYAGRDSRYPEINPEDMLSAGIDLLLLSSEPYPFDDKHLAECRDLLPDADVRLVDGEMFSWYGSHMLAAADYLQDFVEQLAHNPRP